MPRQTLIQVRRDSAADWTSANPTLAAGEFGFEEDTNKLKCGDGSTAWNSLAYVSGASTTQTEFISGVIESPDNQDYRLIVKIPHGGTITETTTISASGTCTATFKINTTALGGTANSVSSTEQSQAHASANAFSADDDIVLTISSNSSCADMSFTIKYTKTLS